MTFALECTVKKETEKALLVIDTDSGEEFWLPLSQVEKILRRTDGSAEVTMSDWIAGQKGLA